VLDLWFLLDLGSIILGVANKQLLNKVARPTCKIQVDVGIAFAIFVGSRAFIGTAITGCGVLGKSMKK